MSTHRFAVRVRPGSARPRVGGAYGDPPALIVAVHAPPVDGRANAAVAAALADALGVRPRAVEIISGQAGRSKMVAVTVPDGEDPAMRARLAELLGSP